MKILICGSSGDVGNNLIKLLSKKNYTITSASRSLNKKSYKNVENIKIDFSKNFKINKKFDLIINCIATHELSNKKSINDYINSNILTPVNILKYFNDKKVKILNLSTISIFDLTKQKVLKENCTAVLSSKLSITKFLGEKILSHGKFEIINLRLPGIITNSLIHKRPWIKNIVSKLKKDQDVYLYNSNKKFNSMIDVNDLVRLIDHLLNKKFISGNYNLSASNPIKLSKLIFHIKDKLNSNSKIITLGNNQSNIIISNNLIKNKLGFKPSTVLQITNRQLDD